jgi:hypothetical protein
MCRHSFAAVAASPANKTTPSSAAIAVAAARGVFGRDRLTGVFMVLS